MSAPNAWVELWSLSAYEYRWRALMKVSTNSLDMTRCTLGNRPESNTCPIPVDLEPIFRGTRGLERSAVVVCFLKRVRSQRTKREGRGFPKDGFKITKNHLHSIENDWRQKERFDRKTSEEIHRLRVGMIRGLAQSTPVPTGEETLCPHVASHEIRGFMFNSRCPQIASMLIPTQ